MVMRSTHHRHVPNQSAGSSKERPWERWLLILTFGLFTGLRLAPYAPGFGHIGLDAVIYTEAASVWLGGGDPWAIPAAGGTAFAAPPPTLLLFAPFTLLPATVVRVLWPVILIVVSALGLRRIGLPMWWLAFPPLSDAIITGNPDGLLFGAIVLGWGPFAVFGKVYAVIPMIGERRWRGLMVSAGLLVVTIPILPWGLFVARLETISQSLDLQAAHMSAFGSLPLMALGVIALGILGVTRAGWLAVPVLWPATQMHYAAIAVPGLTTLTALFFSLPIPGAYLVGVVVAAAVSLATRRAGRSFTR